MAETEKTINQQAIEKITLAIGKDGKKTLLAPVGTYLIKRCTEDQAMAEDVMRKEKTWDGLVQYLMKSARSLAKNQSYIAVEDKFVYEWAEDYFHAEETPQETPQKAPEKRDQKETVKPSTAKEKAQDGRAGKPAEASKPKEEPKARKRTKKGEIEGQLSLFDMLK